MADRPKSTRPPSSDASQPRPSGPPGHPQSRVTKPAEAFRETFLYWIEDPDHHDATRRFGDLLEQLVGEAHIVVRNRREHPPSRTWVAATIRAVLLDLAHLRSVVADIAENIGAPLPEHEVRLMVAVSDLLPELDAWTARLRTAFETAEAAAKAKGVRGAD